MTALPSGALLFDTGIYIRSSRGERYEWLAENGRVFQRTILTAVVAAELYAGTRTPRDKRALDGLCAAHDHLGHFVSPPHDAWIQAGVLMRRARTIFGELHFAHHFRDALVALEAARARATLVTENIADFRRWRSLMASAGLMLKLYNPS